MKFKSLAVTLVAAALFAGPAILPAAESTAAPRVVKIVAGVDNVMKFDVTRVTAAPGETIKIILTNKTTLPKNVMGHNWVLLTAGTDPLAFAAAAASEAANGYIPSKLKEKVIAVVGLLGPDEVGEVTFKAPLKPGDYPYLCSFPAHCLIGMKGVLVVK